MSLLWIFHL